MQLTSIRRARRRLLLLLPPLVLPLLAACEARRTAPEGVWAGEVDTLETNRIVVRNPPRSAASEDPVWRATETLRIGGAEGSGPELFARIFSFDVDLAGRLWILDGRAQEVRVFDADGRFVRTVGRAGNGPGEFARAVRVERAPSGHIWVTDPSNSRISEFDTTGTYLRAVNVPLGCFEIPWPGRFDSAGRFHAVASPDCASILRFSPDFASRTTIAMPSTPRQPELFVVNAPSGQLMAEIPFQGTLAWRIGPNGRVWAMMTDDYQLYELGPDGDTSRVVVVPVDRDGLTDADRQFAMAALQWFIDEGGRVDLTRLPRRRPPVAGFFFADDGTLWVQRFTAPDSLGYVHDIIDAEGRFVGATRLPFSLVLGPAIPIVRDGHLYGLAEDSLGVQSVVRVRIDPPERP